MPGQREHIVQAEHCEELFEHLGTLAAAYSDWRVTCLFYSALHYADAMLAASSPPPGIHPKNHGQRHQLLQTHLAGIYRDYRRLEERSREVRYDLDPADDVATLRTNEFDRIRSFIRTALALPL